MENKNIKLAVRIEEGIVPGSGFHYMLHPFQLESNVQAEVFALMGHVIIEVEEERGERLLKEARAALRHQVEVAVLADRIFKAGEK